MYAYFHQSEFCATTLFPVFLSFHIYFRPTDWIHPQTHMCVCVYVVFTILQLSHKYKCLYQNNSGMQFLTRSWKTFSCTSPQFPIAYLQNFWLQINLISLPFLLSPVLCSNYCRSLFPSYLPENPHQFLHDFRKSGRPLLNPSFYIRCIESERVTERHTRQA